MKVLILFLFSLMPSLALTPKDVVVVYNQASAESLEVAEYYAEKRGVPKQQIIGIPFTNPIVVNQEEFKRVSKLLSSQLSAKKLWTLDGEGVITTQKFKVIVTTYGVPYQLLGTKVPASVNKKGELVPARNRQKLDRDDASFDSELTLIGRAPYMMPGIQKNPFYQSKLSVNGMTMVARIDGQTVAVCKRIVDDAIEVEKTGLYGKCYLDLSHRAEIGDNWLKGIYNKNLELGIPTVIDKNKDVFVTNYPLLDAALYFGWYTGKVSGAFCKPVEKLKKGSVAVHLHSFSAKELRHPRKGWSGPLLTNGATATLGNVFEPYLQLTTNFQLFYDQLTQGKTFVESAWYATPSLSWQNVVLGDPLYRPFKNRKPVTDIDKQYEFLRSKAPFTKGGNLQAVAKKAEEEKSTLYYETIGLVLSNNSDKGLEFFEKSSSTTKSLNQLLANTLHEISYYRHEGNKIKALELINRNIEIYKDTPQVKPLLALRNILDPPPPPPVNEVKPPKK